MFDSTYRFAREYEVLFLRETAPDSAFESQPVPGDWNGEELAQVRLVLHRLTALRIQNAEDVEDLVQETMLTMMQKCPRQGLKKGLLVWGMGILRKKIGNYYRRSNRCTSLNEQLVASDDAVRRALAPQSPEAKVRYAELRALIGRILADLTPYERQATTMLLAGMEPFRIVERLHPERYQNVINRLYRGRQKLQRGLSKYGYGPDR